MSDVPFQVHREILLRLPAEPLFPFRTVCKAWRRIIDDPSFIKSHTSNQLFSNTLLIRNETGAPLYSFSLDSLNFINGRQKIHATPVKQLIRPGVPRLPDLPVASCNGLILLSHDIKRIWAIWNPLTRECHELPQPNIDLPGSGIRHNYGWLMSWGFGYDYATDDYKVVRIDRLCRQEKLMYQTRVYSLKLASWRMINEDCPYDFECLCGPGVFLNGTLHWRSRDIIIALDLATEDYCRLTLPPAFISLEYCEARLHALGGCLIVSYYYYTRRLFDGWVMKDNGVEKSWMKLFSLKLGYIECAGRYRLVAYLKSKGQVLLQFNGGFLWFDIASNSSKRVTLHLLMGIDSSQICPGSLVRFSESGSAIGNVAANRTVRRKRKKKSKRTDTRLKFCVTDADYLCCSDDCLVSPVSSWSCEGED